jgi:hypothetical protein
LNTSKLIKIPVSLSFILISLGSCLVIFFEYGVLDFRILFFSLLFILCGISFWSSYLSKKIDVIFSFFTIAYGIIILCYHYEELSTMELYFIITLLSMFFILEFYAFYFKKNLFNFSSKYYLVTPLNPSEWIITLLLSTVLIILIYTSPLKVALLLFFGIALVSLPLQLAGESIHRYLENSKFEGLKEVEISSFKLKRSIFLIFIYFLILLTSEYLNVVLYFGLIIVPLLVYNIFSFKE